MSSSELYKFQIEFFRRDSNSVLGISQQYCICGSTFFPMVFESDHAKETHQEALTIDCTFANNPLLGPKRASTPSLRRNPSVCLLALLKLTCQGPREYWEMEAPRSAAWVTVLRDDVELVSVKDEFINTKLFMMGLVWSKASRPPSAPSPPHRRLLMVAINEFIKDWRGGGAASIFNVIRSSEHRSRNRTGQAISILDRCQGWRNCSFEQELFVKLCLLACLSACRFCLKHICSYGHFARTPYMNSGGLAQNKEAGYCQGGSAESTETMDSSHFKKWATILSRRSAFNGLRPPISNPRIFRCRSNLPCVLVSQPLRVDPI
ncbi:hypothetical protein CRG98_045268 [Punica granatum]|uniref:Uncharacterized protein n=1 Tax=Punica granatum TaxID=22663 RepID=A0A2I0HRM0_PUNGR|nr:hypothetical protein CRG98_045268 [Punica granatum]